MDCGQCRKRNGVDRDEILRVNYDVMSKVDEFEKVFDGSIGRYKSWHELYRSLLTLSALVMTYFGDEEDEGRKD